MAADHLHAGVQLVGEGFDDAGAQAGGPALGVGRHADAVVSDGQRPVGSVSLVADRDPAPAPAGEGVLQRIDHQFSDDQAQADGNVGVDRGIVAVDVQRQLVMVPDHRGADADAQLVEIGLERHLAEPGEGQLLLQGGDRHDPAVGVGQGGAGLVGLGLAGALQDDAGDDLQTVGDAVLDLLQQDGLFTQQVVLQLLAGPGFGDVGDAQQQPDILPVAIGKQSRVQKEGQGPRLAGLQFDLIGLDSRRAGQGGGQEGAQPGQLPFSVAQAEEGLAHGARRVDLKGLEEGGAGGDDVQIAVQQHQGRGG